MDMPPGIADEKHSIKIIATHNYINQAVNNETQISNDKRKHDLLMGVDTKERNNLEQL